MKHFLLNSLLPASGLVFAVILAVCPLGCKASEDDLDVLEGDFSVPHIENFIVTGSSSIRMNFTKAVTVADARVHDCESEAEFCRGFVSYCDEVGSTLIELDRNTVIGASYILEGQVADLNGNTLTFSIPFVGFNDHPAKIILSEIRNAYGTASVKDAYGESHKVHRSEYVEVYVLESGNLCGIEICSANDGSDRKYSMPAIEVKKGDYITVHMRKIDAEEFDGEGMVSELGDDLTLSTHEDSFDDARDLWSDNTKACFADSDIVYLRNSYDGSIIDVFVYAKSSVYEWKDSFSDVVKAVAKSQVWDGGAGVDNAACSDLITSSAATRSWSRQNVDECIANYGNGLPLYNGRDAWMITANSGSGKSMVVGITPGFRNSSNEYKK